MQQEFTEASADEALNESEKASSELKEITALEASIVCAFLAQICLFMTMVVLSSWSQIEQRILLGDGDMSTVGVIFKLGLWIASIRYTVYFGGVVFRVISPSKLGTILASTSTLLFFGFMCISNLDQISKAVLPSQSKMSFWGAATVWLVWIGSFMVSAVNSMEYLLDKTFAESMETDPEKSIDSEA